MTVINRMITTCFAVTMLVACGSSPPVSYYALSASSSQTHVDSPDAALVGLGPMAVPDYLNRSQMVTRGPGAEMSVDEYARWAEPLGPALHRLVAAEVDGMLEDFVVVSFPYDAAIRRQIEYRILGVVTRFDADGAGNIVLEVQWTIADVTADATMQPNRRRYETRATSAGSPAAIAEAMSSALRLFSRDVADQLSALL